MNEKEQLKACLALQEEIDAKLDDLVSRYKAVLNAHPNEQIIVNIDGTLFQLRKSTEHEEVMRSARKHGGFYFGYRLVKLPKPL